jgi:hypothetical protein
VTGRVSVRAGDLRELAEDLTPLRTMSGAAERARFTVSTVSVVGTAITAFGVLGYDRVAAGGGPVRLLVVGSVCLAVLAVASALSYLTLRVSLVRRRNLAEVESWRDRELRRVQLVVWSGRLLLAAVLLGGAAATLDLAVHRTRATSSVELTDGAKRAAVVSVSIFGAAPGTSVGVRATAEAPGRPDRTILASTLTVDRGGSAALRSTMTDLGDVSAIRVEVVSGDDPLSSARADLAGSP